MGITSRALASAIKRGAQKQRSNWLRLQVKKCNRCDYCNRSIKQGHATVDHIVPVSRGGEDAPENWAIACAHCNLHKSDLMPEQFHLKLHRRRS